MCNPLTCFYHKYANMNKVFYYSYNYADILYKLYLKHSYYWKYKMITFHKTTYTMCNSNLNKLLIER